MRQRFVCQWLSCTFCFTVHLDKWSARGRLRPFSTCSHCLSGCTAAFTCSVFDPLIVGGGLPQGFVLQPHLLEAVCLSRAEKTGKALYHNAFPVLPGSLPLDYGFAASTLCSITGTAHSLCTRSRLIFSATPTPESRMGLTFLAFSGHAEMHRIQGIQTRWHRAALAPLPDLMDGFHRSVHAGLFPIPAKNSRQPWRIPDTASR